MKFSALALDYDGTIALDGVLDPTAREAIAEARQRGIAVILVTGRQLSDLRRLAGDLTCFAEVVAENGAVLDFPATYESGATRTLGARELWPTVQPGPDRPLLTELALDGPCQHDRSRLVHAVVLQL